MNNRRRKLNQNITQHIFFQCPFCPKAFLNSSFLQSHVNRRHNDFSGKAASVGVGAAQSTGQIPQVTKEPKEVFQQFQIQQEHAQTVSFTAIVCVSHVCIMVHLDKMVTHNLPLVFNNFINQCLFFINRK